MEKQRELQLEKEIGDMLVELKQAELDECKAEGVEATFENFKKDTLKYAQLYLDGIEFTEQEQKDFNPHNYTISGEMYVLLDRLVEKMRSSW